MAEKRKAYKLYVANDDDAGCEIVFAATGKAAKARGSDVFSDCDYIQQRVKRMPDFDDASDPPTPQEFWDRGF